MAQHHTSASLHPHNQHHAMKWRPLRLYPPQSVPGMPPPNKLTLLQDSQRRAYNAQINNGELE